MKEPAYCGEGAIMEELVLPMPMNFYFLELTACADPICSWDELLS